MGVIGRLPITQEEAREIGIQLVDIPKSEISNAEQNEICKGRINDLCRLAGFFRPFVFCFDETESYKSEPFLAGMLGIVIATMHKEMPNHMTVVTANVEPWRTSIASQWEQAQLDCLRKPSLELEELNIDQGMELINIRLKDWGINKEDAESVLDISWLTQVFSQMEKIGIRDFLKKCAERFEGPIKMASIEELYAKYVEQVKIDPNRYVYDRDALRWLVQDLSKRNKDLQVEKFKSTKPYLVVRWKKKDGSDLFFGFEDGSNHKRWKAIADEANKRRDENPKSVSVFFRTPQLKKIPGKNWNVAPHIETAKKVSLHIFNLNEEWLARLYGARDLYTATLEGDVTEYGQDKVLDFLAEALKDFWDKIGKLNGPSPPCPKPSKTLISEIRAVIKKEKMMDFQIMKKNLNNIKRLRDCTIRLAIDEIPQIKSYAAGANQTVLLWRS